MADLGITQVRYHSLSKDPCVYVNSLITELQDCRAATLEECLNSTGEIADVLKQQHHAEEMKHIIDWLRKVRTQIIDNMEAAEKKKKGT